MKIAALPLIALAASLCAQAPGAGTVNATAPTLPTKAPPAPTISDAHRAEFFKRQLAFNQATQAYQAAQASLQTSVDAMNKDCGDKFRPQIDQNGDPVCAAIPAAPAPTKK